MPHIEVASPALGAKIVAVLREVRVACAGEESRRIVDRLAQRVRHQSGQPMREPLLEARLQRVIDRIRPRLENLMSSNRGFGR